MRELRSRYDLRMQTKRCDLCARDTQHDDAGECLEHEIVRKTAQAPQRRRGAVIAVASSIAVAWLYGAVHVFYGEGLGIATCWKAGWSLSDTFVDIAVFRGEGHVADKVALAADSCKLIPDASAWERDKLILLTAVIAIVGIVVWRHGLKRLLLGDPK